MKATTTLSEELLKMLSDEPKSEYQLARALHTDGEHIRRCFKELEDNGYNVASASINRGYWLYDVERD